MPDYGTKYVVGLEYTGQGNLQRFAGDVSQVRSVLEQLSGTAGPLEHALGGLDQTLKISEPVLASYDRLLRVMAQLKAAQLSFRETQTQAQIPIGEKNGFANTNARDAALLRGGAAVDARAEAVQKELRSQLTRDLADQERAGRQAARDSQASARQGEQNYGRILQTANSFYQTLQDRNAAAKREAEALKEAASAAERGAQQTSQQSRLSAVDAALAARPAVQYPDADLGTHLGRAQSGVDQAQQRLNLASLKLAEARESDSRSVAGVIAAENREIAATSSLAAAKERLKLVETRTQGSLADQFRTGFKGTNQDRSYVEQIGQAFKFSVFYGTAYKLLFGITQTLQATLQEGIQFEQAMTELAVASGQPKDQLDKLTQTLGTDAVQAGFAPSQGVLVGARSLGLFGAAAGSGASPQDQAYIADISARTVSRIAQGSGGQPADIQTNIAAIANAFGTGAEGQIRAYDLDAYLTRKFGVPQGSTLAPVSEAGTVGKAAGFSQEQVTAISADLIARTGQSPEAVAGYMAQIFSRSGEGALNTLDAKYGVDAQSPLAEQLKELAKVYKNQPEARDEISAAFGRGKVQNAVIALLQDYADVNKASAGAVGGATGAGDKQFNLRMDNLGGQIAKTEGALRDFADAFGQSGLLNVVGAGIIVLRDFVESTTALLREFSKLPGPIRAVVVGMLALAAAQKAGLVGSAIGGLGLGRVGTNAVGASVFERSAAASVLGGRYYGAGTRLVTGAEGSFIAGSAAGRAVPLASGSGVRAVASNAVAGVGALGVAAAVLGDTVLWGSLHSSTEKFAAAQDFAAETLTKSLGPNATPDQLRAHAAALNEAATGSRASTKGLFHDLGILGTGLSLGGNDADALNQANQATAEGRRLEALAKYKDAQATNAPADKALVGGFDADSLSASMQAITATGGTAKDRIDALNASLLGTADAAARVSAAFDPHLFAGSNAAGLLKAITGSTSLAEGSPDSGFHNPFTHNPFKPVLKFNNVGPERIAGALNTDDIAGRLQGALSGVSDPSSLNGKQLNQIANSVLGDTAQKAFGDLDPTQIAQAQKQMRQAIVKYLRRQVQDAKDIISGNHRLDAAESTATANQFLSDAQELANSLPESDYSGRIGAYKSAVTSIIATIRKTKGGATDQDLSDLDSARKLLAEAQISRLEGARKAAQRMAHSDKEIAAIGHGYFAKEVNAAVRGGDTDALVNLVNTAGKYGMAIARQAVEQALKAARAAFVMESQIQAFAANELAGIRGMIGQLAPSGGPTKQQKALVAQYQSMLKALNFTAPNSNGSDNFTTGADSGNPLATDAAAAAPAETALQRRAALASANATRSESAIQQARASILSARAEMASAKKGTVEYYNALQSYYDARNQLTDAILEFKNNKYLLGHDITDPLVQARAGLRAAQAKLRSDAGKPADVRAADQVAVHQAQADVEAQAFQQRLDAVQTAEQLGRMSYGAYINYLNHERDRLKGIAHRSYQQQQELNQIDELLKTAADQMQGQWNFGDIKLPTPYQVRRYIEQQGGGGANGPAGVINDGPKPGSPGGHVTNHNVRIVIDGADTGQILRVLRQYVGSAGRTMTTGTRHR